MISTVAGDSRAVMPSRLALSATAPLLSGVLAGAGAATAGAGAATVGVGALFGVERVARGRTRGASTEIGGSDVASCAVCGAVCAADRSTAAVEPIASELKANNAGCKIRPGWRRQCLLRITHYPTVSLTSGALAFRARRGQR